MPTYFTNPPLDEPVVPAALIERAVALRNSSGPKAAVALLEQVVDWAVENHDLLSEANAVAQIANSVRSYDLDLAFQMHIRAQLIYERLGMLTESARMIAGVANIHRIMSNFHAAAEEFQNALMIFRNSSDKLNLTICLGNYAGALYEAEHRQHGSEILREAIETSHEISDLGVKVWLLTFAAKEYANERNWELAFLRLNEAREIIDANPEESKSAIVYETAGYVHQVAKNFMESSHFYEMAIPYYKKIKELRQLTSIYTNLGHSYVELGRFSDAELCIGDSLQYSRRVGDRRSEATVLSVQGDLYLSRGFYDQAYRSYLESMDIYKNLQNDFRVAQTQVSMAEAVLLQGDWMLALAVLDQAVTYFTQTNSAAMMVHALALKVEVMLVSGDLKQAAEVQHEAELWFEKDPTEASDLSYYMTKCKFLFIASENQLEGISDWRPEYIKAKTVIELRKLPPSNRFAKRFIDLGKLLTEAGFSRSDLRLPEHWVRGL